MRVNEKLNLRRIIMKKILGILVLCTIISVSMVGCDETAQEIDKQKQAQAEAVLIKNQATPTDIDYSLERYNLIRRTYWVNGQREKANTLPCEIEKPLGYIVLMSESGAVLGNFIVDGKVTSLNSFLSPDSEYYESSTTWNNWLADVDGSYGENDNGIFFFTPDGKYIEWTGTYLYSDIPFEVADPVLKVGGNIE